MASSSFPKPKCRTSKTSPNFPQLWPNFRGTFQRLEGNAVMVSGYNRWATIQHSDFAYLGGNAVVAWGYTNETSSDPGRPGVALANAPRAGVDGTDGEHPVLTTVQSRG